MRIGTTSVASLLVAALAAATFFYFSYQAGCAGDLKEGVLGNPQQAIHYEGISIGPMFVALLALSALPFLGWQVNAVKRVLISIAIFVIGLTALNIGGTQFEIMGSQQCFSR